jgi:acyl-CoA thioester hydrolase
VEDGIYLAVAESHCRYRSPARFDDEVIVRTWIETVNTRMVTFAYEMRAAEGDRRLATGSTRHVFVSRAMRPTHLPAKYHALFGIAATV